MKRNLLLLGTLWSLLASAQKLDSFHIMVDAGAKDNTPYIPGSSLKGKMRCLLEQVAGATQVGLVPLIS